MRLNWREEPKGSGKKWGRVNEIKGLQGKLALWVAIRASGYGRMG
jgi:hypothetical protein